MRDYYARLLEEVAERIRDEEIVSKKEYDRLASCVRASRDVLEGAIQRLESTTGRQKVNNVAYAKDMRVYLNALNGVLEETFMKGVQFTDLSHQFESLKKACRG